MSSFAVLNVYHRDATNAGDLASSPFRYFSFHCEISEHGASSSEQLPVADAVVVGGGGLISNLTFTDAINQSLESVKGPKILWGAGDNHHSYPFAFSKDLDGIAGLKSELRGFLTRVGFRHASSWTNQLLKDSKQYPTIDQRYDLIGVRDWGTRYRWVPCVSCMHPIFDLARSRPPVRKFLIVDHPLFFKITSSRIKKISNLGISFEKVISELSEAETIITSSYHAAYWGILLDRKVVVVPWSTKFLRFRWPVEIAFDLDGLNKLCRNARTFPGALDESRSANLSFAKDVSLLLSVKIDLKPRMTVGEFKANE
jgi:hypothetical protein